MPPEARTQARNCGCRETVWEAYKEEFSNGVIWRSSRLPGEVRGPPLTQVLEWINRQRCYECHIDFRWWFKKGSLCPWKTEVLYSWSSNITGLNYAVTLTDFRCPDVHRHQVLWSVSPLQFHIHQTASSCQAERLLRLERTIMCFQGE